MSAPGRSTAGRRDTERREQLAAPELAERRSIASTARAPWLSAGMALGVLVWVVWRTGPGKVPAVENFTRIADGWPNIPLPPQGSYILRVPLGQLVYGALPFSGTAVFLAVHAACLVACAFLLAAWFVSRLGFDRAMVACTVVLCAPVTAVLLLWLGMYDAYSILAWCLVLFSLSRRGPAQLAAGAIAGFQNFEQVAVGVILMVLARPLVDAAGLRVRAAWLLGGALVGKLALEGYLTRVGATPGGRAAWFDAEKVQQLIVADLTLAPIILWSALAGMWGFAVTALLSQWGNWHGATRVRLVVGVAVWLSVAAATADHTRVLAMTSFPLMVMGALVIAQEVPSARLWRLPQWWMLLLAPPLVVWTDRILPMGLKLDMWGIGPF